MVFDFACVCSCETQVLRPVVSLDGPDLTDTARFLSMAGSVCASDENSLMCSL